jgi:hypothetical protein
MSILKTALITLLILLPAAGSLADEGACGSKVIFDCDKHEITFEGSPSTTPVKIDCGESTQPVSSGIIYGKAEGGGPLAGADVVALQPEPCDQCGVHTMPPKDGKPISPGADISQGCIHVDPDTLKKLEGCANTPYELKHEHAGAANGSGAKSGSKVN